MARYASRYGGLLVLAVIPVGARRSTPVLVRIKAFDTRQASRCRMARVQKDTNGPAERCTPRIVRRDRMSRHNLVYGYVVWFLMVAVHAWAQNPAVTINVDAGA